MKHYISLGVDCTIANKLKERNIKSWTLPFDWNVTYKNVSNIFINNFTNYYCMDNKWYNTSYYIGFFHDKIYSEDNNSKFQRRIQRLHNILSSNDDVVFIRKSHRIHLHEEYKNDVTLTTDIYDNYSEIKDMMILNNYLSFAYPNLKYSIHLIQTCSLCPEKYDNNVNKLFVHDLHDCEELLDNVLDSILA